MASIFECLTLTQLFITHIENQYFTHIMIQRSLLRNAAAISCPSRSLSRQSFFSSPLSPIRAISSPLPRRTAISRFYSTPVDPAVNADASSSAASQAASDGEEEEESEPWKKDLFTKDREIIDLKVRPPPFFFRFRNTSL